MIREKMQNIQMKRVVILSIPYLIIFYLADKCFWLYRHCIGDSMIEKIGVMLMNFQLAFTNWLPSFPYARSVRRIGDRAYLSVDLVL